MHCIWKRRAKYLEFQGKEGKGERKLILKKLTIEHFEKIQHYETSFDPKLSVISDSNADDIVRAIGIVTNNRILAGRITKEMLSVNTCIRAEIEAQGTTFLVTARGQPSECGWEYDVREKDRMESMSPSKLFRSIRLCEEEEALTYYRYNGKDRYSERFLHYKDPEKYYASGEFQKKTDGDGLTRSFRACLTEYMKVHEADGSPFGDNSICILPDGRLIGNCGLRNPKGQITDGTSSWRFDFLCYLHVIKFWDCFQDIRDMHHEKWPIIIEAGEPYDSDAFAELLETQGTLGRQVILKWGSH